MTDCLRCGKPRTWHLGLGGMGMCVPLQQGLLTGGYIADEPSLAVPTVLTAEALAAKAIGASFAVAIGAGPTSVFTWPRGSKSYEAMSEDIGLGRDIDDLALMLVRAGHEVEIVRVQERGGCRLRDKKTGGWFIEEQSTGHIYLVKP